MKTFIILLLLTSLSSVNLFGQENFVSGMVITVAGDTLKGSIDDQRWQYTPASVKFRNASGTPDRQKVEPDLLEPVILG